MPVCRRIVMHRLVAGAIVCASIVPLISGCAKRSQRNQVSAVPVNAAPVGKESGATVRSAILGAGASGPAGAAITRQMDKQAQELAFDLPGAIECELLRLLVHL